MTKKQKKIFLIGSVMLLAATVAIGSPLIILQFTNNGNKSSGTNSLHYVASKQFKEPIIPKYVDGMINDSKKYDELIAERVKSIVKTQDENSLKFETDEVTFKIDKPTIVALKKYLTDDDIQQLIIYFFKNSNFTLSNKYNLSLALPKKLFCWLTINDHLEDDAIGYASPGNEIVIKIENILNIQSIVDGIDGQDASKKKILEYITDVYFHELGHRLQNDYSQSRSSIWDELNHHKQEIFSRFLDQSMNSKSKAFSPYQNLFYSLKLQDVFDKLNKYNFVREKTGSYDYLSNIRGIDFRFDQMIERYYRHDKPIVKNIEHLNYPIMRGRGSSFFLNEHSFFSEFMTRMQVSWMETYNNWDEVINQFRLAFGEQVETARVFNLNLYPLDTSFSRKFMAAYFKYFMGIGDVNNLEIKRDEGTYQDHIWFGATSTALSKKVKQVKLTYPDTTYTLFLQTKDYPIGWNYQPWTVGEKFYKYVARAKYGYMTIPHHDALPQKITLLDQYNNELSNDDVQLLHGEVEDNTNIMVRYIYNDATSTWEENYQNT